MTKRKSKRSRDSERGRAHDAMLEAALARPGVREVMEIFGAWQHADRQLDAYRSAATPPAKIETTNSSRAV